MTSVATGTIRDSASADSAAGSIARTAAVLLSLTTFAVPIHAQQSRRLVGNEETAMVDKSEAWRLYSRLHTAWNSNSLDERVKIAAEVLDENIEYQTVRHNTTFGRALVIEDMETFHEIFPGGHFEIGDVSAHHNVALLTWVLIQADGTEFARGGDQITVGPNGKIVKIITFGPSSKSPD